jgi:hypothetical protein
MSDKEYSQEIVFDPPLTQVDKENHDYVRLEITSEQELSLDWFVQELKKTDLWERLVVEFQKEQKP